MHETDKYDTLQVMEPAAGADTRVVKCDCGLALQGANLTLNTVSISVGYEYKTTGCSPDMIPIIFPYAKNKKLLTDINAKSITMG